MVGLACCLLHQWSVGRHGRRRGLSALRPAARYASCLSDKQCCQWHCRVGARCCHRLGIQAEPHSAPRAHYPLLGGAGRNTLPPRRSLSSLLSASDGWATCAPPEYYPPPPPPNPLLRLKRLCRTQLSVRAGCRHATPCGPWPPRLGCARPRGKRGGGTSVSDRRQFVCEIAMSQSHNQDRRPVGLGRSTG